MKKEPKEKPVETRRRKKEILSKDKQNGCEEFKKNRLSFGMNQKQWAEKVGISYGLVKRIESHTIACSEKTTNKVRMFMDSYNAPPDDLPGMHDLEVRILYDVLLTYMADIPIKNAKEHAIKCARSLRAVLSKASGCSSPGAKEKYFEFMEMFLKALGDFDADSVDITEMEMSRTISNVFSNKNPRKSSSADKGTSKYGNEFNQVSLLEGQLLDSQ